MDAEATEEKENWIKEDPQWSPYERCTSHFTYPADPLNTKMSPGSMKLDWPRTQAEPMQQQTGEQLYDNGREVKYAQATSVDN